MKYCENGHSNRDDAKFCGTCGKPIVQKSADFTLDKFSNIKFEVTDYEQYRYTDSDMLMLGFIFGVIPGIIMLIICSRLKKNSDFMEVTNSYYCRIAKSGKLGIFDKSRNIVRLPSRYDKIEKIDDEYYDVQLNGRCGVFSILCNKLIVPVKYEYVKKSYNGVWTAVKKGKITYYNCNGKDVK